MYGVFCLAYFCKLTQAQNSWVLEACFHAEWIGTSPVMIAHKTAKLFKFLQVHSLHKPTTRFLDCQILLQQTMSSKPWQGLEEETSLFLTIRGTRVPQFPKIFLTHLLGLAVKRDKPLKEVCGGGGGKQPPFIVHDCPSCCGARLVMIFIISRLH